MKEKQERVKYKKSALREVIFQVRFPSILKISSEEPSAFQELIRGKYPLYISRKNNAIIGNNWHEQASSGPRNHQFVSSDGLSKVNLTNSFIALSTLAYDRWEFFEDHCKDLLDSFCQIYNPTVVLRVGLRYKDVITRSKWGLQGVPWQDLIKDKELGPMTLFAEEAVNNYTLDLEIITEDNVVEHRHFSLIREVSSPNEKSFLIDCDYYSQGQIRFDEVLGISKQLHDHSSNFIRSVITDRLNEAMEPESI